MTWCAERASTGIRSRSSAIPASRRSGNVRSSSFAAELTHLDRILGALKGRSVLTVTDTDGAAPRGVIIGLLRQDNRIRLRIDLEAARANNLTISSKLLRPAEIVGAGS